jgi:hypothetical protein
MRIAIVITNGNIPVAKLTILNSLEQIISESENQPQPGLNLGAIIMSDDFDCQHSRVSR